MEVRIPRFFFDLFQDGRFDPDPEGVEFPDLETAYLDVFKAAKDMWIEVLRESRDPRRDWLKIRDMEGRLLVEIPFLEVVENGRRSTRPIPPAVASLLATAKRAERLQMEVIRGLEAATQALMVSRELLSRQDDVTYRGR